MPNTMGQDNFLHDFLTWSATVLRYATKKLEISKISIICKDKQYHFHFVSLFTVMAWSWPAKWYSS